jgi:Xaa-Pro dipeptidase
MPNERIAALAAALEGASVDAFFAWSPVTMGYLHGLHESAHERFLALAISKTGDIRLIAPALTESQARRVGITDVRPWKDGEDPIAHVLQLAKDWNLDSAIVAVDDEMPARMLIEIQDALPRTLFRPGGAIASSLMRQKSAEEIDLLLKAGKMADDAWDMVLPTIKAGQTEVEVMRNLFAAMEERGGTPTFGIIAAGPNGAEPHHLSDDTVLKEGDVVICDFGCSYQGYQSDITRTIAIGSASDEAKKIYDIVLRGHQAGRAAIRAGVTAGSVDGAARQVIAGEGYGDAFFHRLGHGIGQRGHEEPYIIGTSEVELLPGDCFSIEPGIYLAGRFGVRIENIVSATEAGHLSMNAEPASELIVV